jgi:hypothetical protein
MDQNNYTAKKIAESAWSALSDSPEEIQKIQRILNMGTTKKNSSAFHSAAPINHIRQSINSKRDFTASALEIKTLLSQKQDKDEDFLAPNQLANSNLLEEFENMSSNTDQRNEDPMDVEKPKPKRKIDEDEYDTDSDKDTRKKSKQKTPTKGSSKSEDPEDKGMKTFFTIKDINDHN